MEQKTDLSREFGLLPSRRQQEFGSESAALDPKTDLSPEFSHPPDNEFGDAQKHQEFAHDSTTEGTSKKLTRRERHRRTLLLQMAAIGLSAVVVTSSFGQDILGDDMLFTDTGDSSESYSSFIYVEEVIESSKHDEEDDLDMTRYLIYGDGESDPGPYADSVRYDKRSNTLYLDGCKVDILQISNMDDDITVYVEDNSYVGLLECYGGSLTIAGKPGTSLIVNQHDEEVNWWHGIILYGKGTDAALTITPGITVDVSGGGAIAIDNTTAAQGIVFDEAYTTLSGGTVQSGHYIFEHGVFVDDGGAPDWTVVDEDGNEAEHVVFSSGAFVPGSEIDPGSLEELWIHVDTANSSGLLIEGGELTEFGASVADDVFFDLNSSTLRINSDNVHNIYASWSLPTNFFIHIDRDTTLHSINVTFRPDCGPAYLVLTGTTGSSLRIFPEDADSPTPAISLDAMGENHALNIYTGISVYAQGAQGADAIQIINTLDPTGIVYDNRFTHASGSVVSGRLGYESDYAEGAWDYSVSDHSYPESGPAEHVEFIYSGTNPDDDPVEPDISGISRLSITTTDRTVYQLWLDGEGWNPAPSVASYDPDTNTLTIGGAQLAVIEANFMGDDFTIHVTQDASVGTISSAGCSIILSGENTRLIVNDDMSHTYGIYIDAFGGNCWLQIDPGLTVESLGQEAGIAIANSWANPGLVYDSTLTYVYEPVMVGDYWFPSSGSDSDSTQDTTVIDEKDPFQGPSTHVYIEGSYIELEPDPPVEEPLLNKYSDLYVTLPGDYTPIYIVENGQLTGNEQQVDGLSYDINTNTLTLSDYVGNMISANVMGDDFTIYLQGENRVGMIAGSGNNNIAPGSVTITGDRDAVLILNEDSSQMYAIALSGDNTDTRLTIDGGINVTAYGEQYYAIHVMTTTAENAISVHESLTVTGGTISASYTQGALKPESMNWLFYTDDGQLSKSVSFQTIRQGGILLTLTPDSEPVSVYQNGVLGSSVPGVTYDPTAGTLYLTDLSADKLEIRGIDEVHVYLSGSSSIGQIYADGSLHFAGVPYSALAINQELRYINGLVIDAHRSESMFSAQWGPDIQVYGRDSAAIAVYDSTALNGIQLGTEMLLSGYITQGSLAYDNFDPMNGVRSWTVYDTYGTVLPSRYVAISSNHEGGPSEDAQLTITMDGVTTVMFADGITTAEASSLSGISYEHATNTLSLNGVTFDSIEAYHMGSEFTIELSGENYGQNIISVGSADSDDGNVYLRGDQKGNGKTYGSLYLTSDVNPYGILLEANGGSSMLQLDWMDTLMVTAPETGIMVRNTTVNSGIWDHINMMEGQIVQEYSDAGNNWYVTDYSTGEPLTTVSMHGGYGGGFYDVEHNGIIAFEPPSSAAQRWIYVDTFSPIYVDDPTYDYLETFEGVTYDETTNTLTLNNCDVVNIVTVLMGDDFTIELVGDNYVDEIIINASNVTFTGTGSLTVYAAHSGLRLEAQNRPHYIRIEHGVTMQLVSSYSAIRIHASTAEQPFILADGVSISGTLATGFHNDSCYNVTPDYSAGAVNYSFINSKRSCDEFTEYVHGTDLRITSN